MTPHRRAIVTRSREKWDAIRIALGVCVTCLHRPVYELKGHVYRQCKACLVREAAARRVARVPVLTPRTA